MFGTPPVGGLLKGRQKDRSFAPTGAHSPACLYQGFASLHPWLISDRPCRGWIGFDPTRNDYRPF